MLQSSEVSLMSGDSVRLRCDAVGRPRVQVQWYKDEKMLSASTLASSSRSSSDGTPSPSRRRVRHSSSRRRRRSEPQGHVQGHVRGQGQGQRSAADLLLDTADELYADVGDERLSLSLKSVTVDDSGLYTCRVFNKAGAVNFTYSVQVAGNALSDIQSVNQSLTVVLHIYVY